MTSENTPRAQSVPIHTESNEGASTHWIDLITVAGQLIAAVERAVEAVGADFASVFRSVRLELADDYSFLDPFSSRFQYSNSVVRLTESVSVGAFVNGICEALRRVVDQIAIGNQETRVRERVAVELAVLARERAAALQSTGFRDELDRVARTKVI